MCVASIGISNGEVNTGSDTIGLSELESLNLGDVVNVGSRNSVIAASAKIVRCHFQYHQ